MPTVVIGNNTGDDYAGTEDTRLVQTSPTTNYGSGDAFDMHKAVADQYLHSIIRFSGLSNISAGVTVSSAVLSLYHFNGTSVQTFSLRRLLRNWVEAQATWNIYSTGNNWSTAGATSDGNDRSSGVSATLTSSSSTGRYRNSGDLSADVESFINGDLTNNGWHGERTDGADDGNIVRFRSANIGDGYRPYLSVTYEESGGTGNSYYYQQQQM
jgi:hypothetical protein